MRVKKETIRLAKIRRLVREAIRWYLVDDGMPTFWSTLNYRRSKHMKGKTLGKDEQHYEYYVKSSRAIEDIAKQIAELK